METLVKQDGIRISAKEFLDFFIQYLFHLFLFQSFFISLESLKLLNYCGIHVYVHLQAIIKNILNPC